ncbi:MAG: T9SS type A sorting domain-containing protein, partial [Bacteroidia bacterium]|nr:T9SS type A sorting domain-containing protein [Bacteroidia bacterium]
AYVCFSGFGTNHLYKTSDFGFNWEAIDQDLPDVPGNAIAIDPQDSNILYYGNDIGIYVSEDGGLSWTAWDSGLPKAVIAMDLTISPSDRKIWVATHGNGSYRADMIESSVSSNELTTGLTRFNIFPNPANSVLNINADIPDAKIEWTLYELSGRKLGSGTGDRIMLDDIVNGIYLVELKAGIDRSLQKFVVRN